MSSRHDTPTTVRLLTVPEAGQRLGNVGRRTVYRLVESGALRTVNVAATGTKPRMRIREDDLAAFIESRTSSAPTADVAGALASTA